MDGFVERLLLLSERGAVIARRCREEEELFRLLVEEKKGDENTKLSGQDFKTLADVLVQETIRSLLGEEYPPLKSHIYGEESNMFTNTKGQQITVKVCETQQSTAALLSEAMDGNDKAASLLAQAVHEPLDILRPKELDQLKEVTFDPTKYGVWIDPIDGTLEYIEGLEGVTEEGIYLQGLQCVTVLIGVYDLSTGQPVVGVVNQPFNRQDSDGKWSGRMVWGVAMNGLNIASCSPHSATLTSPTPRDKVCVLSKSVEPELVAALQAANWKLVFAPGAGYKQLCVADGLASVYLHSKSGCYKWDTCGPHVILIACGGGITCWGKVMEGESVSEGVRYHRPDREGLSGPQQWQNYTGVLAYKNVDMCKDLIRTVSIK